MHENQLQQRLQWRKKEPEFPIHGDLLLSVLSRLPLIDLVPAAAVSTAWSHAISSPSFSHLNPPKPWLLLHSPSGAATLAFDPSSHHRLLVKPPSPLSSLIPPRHSILRSPLHNFLYASTPCGVFFSSDPFHLLWHHAPAPSVHRTDPLVVFMGSTILLAGGAAYYEHDPSLVEVYDIPSRRWVGHGRLPPALKGLSAATWCAVEVCSGLLMLADTGSGVAYRFVVETGELAGPFPLGNGRPSAYFFRLGVAGGRVILVELVGSAGEMAAVKIYEVCTAVVWVCVEIGEMPASCIQKLKGGEEEEEEEVATLGVSMADDYVYIYNPWRPENVVFLEMESGGAAVVKRWGSLGKMKVLEEEYRVWGSVYSCSKVGIEDLRVAMASCSFSVLPVVETSSVTG